MKDKLGIVFLLSCLALGVGYADNSSELIEPIRAQEYNYHIDSKYQQVYDPLVNSDGESKLPHLYALHINGIGTTYREASDNMEELQKVSQLKNGRNYVSWDFVYNPTAEVVYTKDKMDINRRLFHNIYDVIHQKNRELKLNEMMSLDNYLDGLLQEQVSPEAREVLREMVRPDYQALIKEYSGYNIDDVIDNFHQKIPPQFASVMQRIGLANELGENYKQEPVSILLLPHSQGNLYANELYQYLTLSEDFNSKHIAIFGVASPAERNLGQWPLTDTAPMIVKLRNAIKPAPVGFITDCSDSVINILRKEEWIRQVLLPFNIILPKSVQIPGIAACNYNDPTGGLDSLNHNLIEHYLYKANPDLRDRIAMNINYFAYVLDYNLMQDLTNNLIPKDKGFNKYPQTIAFAIGDAKLNDTQILDVNSRKIWGFDYDLDKNPSGFLYVQEPLLDKIIPTGLMHFVAAPSKDIVSDGYSIKDAYGIHEDPKNGKYQNSLFNPFYIYPLGAKYTTDAGANSFILYSYPWDWDNNKWPWDSAASGNCYFALLNYDTMPEVGNSFANTSYGVWVIQKNRYYSDLSKCLKMPPDKSKDMYIMDGLFRNKI